MKRCIQWNVTVKLSENLIDNRVADNPIGKINMFLFVGRFGQFRHHRHRETWQSASCSLVCSITYMYDVYAGMPAWMLWVVMSKAGEMIWSHWATCWYTWWREIYPGRDWKVRIAGRNIRGYVTARKIHQLKSYVRWGSFFKHLSMVVHFNILYWVH